jgi:hypothetical protein
MDTSITVSVRSEGKEEAEFEVSKNVLAACSPVFQAMFFGGSAGAAMTESSLNELVIDDDLNAEQVKAFLDIASALSYTYTEKVYDDNIVGDRVEIYWDQAWHSGKVTAFTPEGEGVDEEIAGKHTVNYDNYDDGDVEHYCMTKTRFRTISDVRVKAAVLQDVGSWILALPAIHKYQADGLQNMCFKFCSDLCVTRTKGVSVASWIITPANHVDLWMAYELAFPDHDGKWPIEMLHKVVAYDAVSQKPRKRYRKVLHKLPLERLPCDTILDLFRSSLTTDSAIDLLGRYS